MGSRSSGVQRLAGRPLSDWGDGWPGWESLDYVALEAHVLLTGESDDCGDAFYDAVDAQKSSEARPRDPADERWDVRDEEEESRKLWGLSSMFPLSVDA